MKQRLMPWVRLPTRWIEACGLRSFRWAHGEGADNLAALMTLTAISHHADEDTGIAELTYGELQEITTLSRAKLAAGLEILVARGQIQRRIKGRSSFRLADYDPKAGWAAFPARGLYEGTSIYAFKYLHLRHPTELDAVKLFFLFASRRDRRRNVAMITYEKIEEYSGVAHNGIRRALSWLTLQGLVHIERVPSRVSENGIANGYRLAHLDSRYHMGTRGRADDWWTRASEDDDPSSPWSDTP
jgi:hypothetical protein